MLKTIDASDYKVYLGDGAWRELEEYIQSKGKETSKVFVLVDENTYEHCLPYFLLQVSKYCKT